MAPQEADFEKQLAEIDALTNTDIEQAIEKAHALYHAARKKGDKNYEGLAARMIGIGLYKANKFKEAISFFEVAIGVWKKLDDSINIVNDFISVGASYRNIGQSDKALEYYLFAKKLSEKHGIIKARLYNNIAVIYHRQNDLKQAIKFYKLALETELKSKTPNKQYLASILNNIAFAFGGLNDYEKAKSYHSQAKGIAEDLNLNFEKISSSRGLGKILGLEKEYEDALNIFNDALDMCEKLTVWDEYIKISIELSPILRGLKRYDERTRRLKYALKLAIEHHQDSIVPALEALLEHYEEMEDYANSYHVLKQLSDLREQSIEIERQHKINELQTKFEVQEKDKLLQQEKEFRKALEAQNNTLNLLNQDLQQFNYAVSHDLKEPLRSIRAYSRFLSNSLREKLNEDEQSALNSLEQSVKRVDNMIDDLLSFATLGSGEKAMVQVNLNEIAALVQADLQVRIKENNAVIEVKELPTIQAHKGMMVQLFQNLINNAIKFRKEDVSPVVEISSKQTDEWLEIYIKDNGVGIPEKHQKDVFKIFKRLDKTRNVEGTGIGLSLCQKIITKMQGTIGLASVEGEGTTFIIRLPIT